MEIKAILNPLYKDLLKQGFEKYIEENHFQRLCTEHGLLDIWTAAYNDEANKTLSFEGFDQYNNSNAAVLAGFLNRLHLITSGLVPFCHHIALLLVGYINTTQTYIDIEEIIKDLKTLGIHEPDELAIQNAYRAYDNNPILKVDIVYSLMYSLARTAEADEGIYLRIREQLMNLSTVKDNLPNIVIAYDNLREFRSYLQSLGGYQVREAYINKEFSALRQLVKQRRQFNVQVQIDERYIQET